MPHTIYNFQTLSKQISSGILWQTLLNCYEVAYSLFLSVTIHIFSCRNVTVFAYGVLLQTLLQSIRWYVVCARCFFPENNEILNSKTHQAQRSNEGLGTYSIYFPQDRSIKGDTHVKHRHRTTPIGAINKQQPLLSSLSPVPTHTGP